MDVSIETLSTLLAPLVSSTLVILGWSIFDDVPAPKASSLVLRIISSLS